MNIFKHELRLYRKSTLTWTFSLVFIIILFAMIYPSFKDSMGAIEQVLDNFPEAFKKALGLSTMNLSEVLGFYGFMFVYITLTGAIQAMNMGLSILSNELIDKTADFLLAKPVKRINIVHAKLQAVLINLLFTNIVFTIVAKIALDVISDDGYSFKIFILFNVSLLLIQLFFVSLGMFVSVFMDKMKSVVPVSLGIVFGFFVVNLLNESLTDQPLSAVTPFAYFATGKIYETGGYNMGFFLLNIVLILTFTLGAYIKYIKKDIPSV